MRIKTKIQIALLVIFAAFAMLGIFSSYYLDRIAKRSVQMTQENYSSLGYTRGMSTALGDVISVLTLQGASYSFKRKELMNAYATFERYLELQSKNITEQGEEDITDQLYDDFNAFRRNIDKTFRAGKELDVNLYEQSTDIAQLLEQVYEINENNILNIAAEANETVNRATLWMIIAGFIFFVIAVILMFYLPDFVSNPVQRMTVSMRQIAEKDYSQRVKVYSNDEFGEMGWMFNLMAEKLEEYDQYNVAQLISEKSRIELLISRMREAIVGIDNQQIILFANPVAERLLGIKEDDLIGRKAVEVASENTYFKDMMREIMAGKVIENGTYSSIQMEINGQMLYFSKDILQVQHTGDESDTYADYGHVVVLKNITKLKEENLAKTNFMARLSHELKTPLAAIDMSINLINDERIGAMNEEQKDLSKTIVQNTGRMLGMVNELLEMAKIETGNIQLKTVESDANTVINSALQSVKTFIDEKKIKIAFDIEPDLPRFKMDVEKTHDVLVNFLTNAIRYSSKRGEIRIAAATLVDTMAFSVRDDGPGLKAEDLRQVFQKYKRAENDKTKGTGLGLAISKEFIEAQGGRIWAESEVGKGSAFFFSLPL